MYANANEIPGSFGAIRPEDFRGVTRNVDKLGRVVMPMEFRKNLGIGINDPLEIFLVHGGVFLRKQENGE